MNPYVLLAIALLLVATVAITVATLHGKGARAKMKDARAAASALGMSFEETPDDLPFAAALPRWQTVPRIHNVMSGTILGTTVAVFEYRWGLRLISAQTVAAFKVPRDVPRFAMIPYRIGFTFESEIDFPSHSVFSQKYALESDDESAVRALFSDRVLRFFEAQNAWCMLGGGEWLLFYEEDKLVPPQAVETFLLKARAAADIFRR